MIEYYFNKKNNKKIKEYVLNKCNNDDDIMINAIHKLKNKVDNEKYKLTDQIRSF